MSRYRQSVYRNGNGAVERRGLLNEDNMTTDERERLLDYNETLCRKYNQTEDDEVLQQIAVTEYLLFNDPDHITESEL